MIFLPAVRKQPRLPFRQLPISLRSQDLNLNLAAYETAVLPYTTTPYLTVLQNRTVFPVLLRRAVLRYTITVTIGFTFSYPLPSEVQVYIFSVYSLA